MDIKLTRKEKYQKIKTIDDVYRIMQRILLSDNKIDQAKEHLWVLCLSVANRVLNVELVALGTSHSVLIDPRDIYHIPLIKNATQIILIHNHPSEDLTPSEDDKLITDLMIQAGHILHVTLVDHLIITPKNFVSFAAIGLMKEIKENRKTLLSDNLIEALKKEKEAILEERALREKAEEEAQQAKLALAKVELEKKALINALLEKNTSFEDIAKMIGVSVEEVRGIVGGLV